MALKRRKMIPHNEMAFALASWYCVARERVSDTGEILLEGIADCAVVLLARLVA